MNAVDVLGQLDELIASRRDGDPELSYVARLLHKGEDTVHKKVGEEAVEVVMAGKTQDASKIVYESADLVFHTMVMLSYYNLSFKDVVKELARREGMSGLDEKASRVETLKAPPAAVARENKE